MAHQSTVNTLEQLEKQEAEEVSTEASLSSLRSAASNVLRLPTKKSNGMSRWLDVEEMDAVNAEMRSADRRTPVWVNDLIFD
jgi:hypothetical protein